MTLLPRIIRLLREAGVFERHLLVAGGVIPEEDAAELRALGVRAVVGQDTPPDEVVERVRELMVVAGTRG
jgi:methylmalonyl-CoA mutase cobalamin-binding domain/chain